MLSHFPANSPQNQCTAPPKAIYLHYTVQWGTWESVMKSRSLHTPSAPPSYFYGSLCPSVIFSPLHFLSKMNLQKKYMNLSQPRNGPALVYFLPWPRSEGSAMIIRHPLGILVILFVLFL